MRKLISCAYHEDSQTVELLYTDGTLIDIDCMAIEDEVVPEYRGEIRVGLSTTTRRRKMRAREFA